ncbi:MAG: hypothetical protein ACAI44_28150 [Candidatus Sericytochromatia bacterium]
MTLILPATLLLAGPSPALAKVRGSAHGLTSAQLRQLRQLPVRAVLPGKLPPGYQFKILQVTTGKEPGYQLDYRCFCGGMNYTITLLGTTRPLKPGKAGAQQTVSAKGLGTHLKLGLYPPSLGIRQPFYMTSWLSKPPLQIGVISAQQGHSAPQQDLLTFIDGLVYLP